MKENSEKGVKMSKRRRILVLVLTTVICAIGMLIMRNFDALTALTFGSVAGILIVATTICVVDYALNPQDG